MEHQRLARVAPPDQGTPTSKDSFPCEQETEVPRGSVEAQPRGQDAGRSPSLERGLREAVQGHLATPGAPGTRCPAFVQLPPLTACTFPCFLPTFTCFTALTLVPTRNQ